MAEVQEQRLILVVFFDDLLSLLGEQECRVLASVVPRHLQQKQAQTLILKTTKAVAPEAMIAAGATTSTTRTRRKTVTAARATGTTTTTTSSTTTIV